MHIIITELQQQFAKVTEHLHHGYKSLQVGQANASLIEDISIEAYGNNQPLKNIASISITGGTTLQVQPWDKSILQNIYQSLSMSDLDLPVVNNGEVLLINIPPLTSERRLELVKIVHKLSEDARISVRTTRQDAMQKIKNMKTAGDISEDIWHELEDNIQKEVDAINTSIESIAKKKEEQITHI